MSSLSRSMATFKIHQDDEENLAPATKNTGPTTTKICAKNRSVLGVLSANLEIDHLKNLKGKNVIDPIKLKPKTVEENKINKTELGNIKKVDLTNIKKPELCNFKKAELCTKPNINVPADGKENPLQKKAPVRTPLKELIHPALKSIDENQISKNDSPMSIDGSPQVVPSTISQLEDFYSCALYRGDVFKHLKQLETQYRPKSHYMKRQPDVTYSMRTILVDWLVEVGEEYKLHNETLFMAVAFLDRFLSSMAVARAKLQLLGTSAMLIAAKFEEIFPPAVSEFTYITDNTYTKKQVLRMEHLILKVLSFELSSPTTCTFVKHIATSAKLPDRNMYLAMYICELSLLEGDPYFDFVPSIIASGAIALARHCLGFIDVWPFVLSKTTGYRLSQLAPVLKFLNETHNKSFTSKHVAIKDKYKSSKLESASQIPHKKLVVRE